jgi:hypothetical protein
MNEKTGKYEIERIDQDGKYLVKIYNMNAKKECNRQIAYYSFQSNKERREAYIESFKKNVQDRENGKKARADARKAFINPAKVGDILESSWGYDQTNVDYYQVTKVKGKMVEIREIGAQTVPESTYSHGMADMVKPVRDRFLDKETLNKIVRGSSYKDYFVKIESFAYAYKIKEEDQTYRSWFA